MSTKDQTPRSALRTVRIVLWAMVAVLVAAIGATTLVWTKTGTPVAAAIGGPFTAVDQKGNAVTEAVFKGHPSALFFGYTSCPDVCPTTLIDAAGWLKKLGPDGDRLKVYFVTVDPERDTQQQIASYLSAFDPRIIGLTGTQAQIDGIIKAYRVYARKVPGTDGDYTMDHTATVYLLDDAGQFVGTLDYHENQETVMAKLKRLLGVG